MLFYLLLQSTLGSVCRGSAILIGTARSVDGALITQPVFVTLYRGQRPDKQIHLQSLWQPRCSAISEDIPVWVCIDCICGPIIVCCEKVKILIHVTLSAFDRSVITLFLFLLLTADILLSSAEGLWGIQRPRLPLAASHLTLLFSQTWARCWWCHSLNDIEINPTCLPSFSSSH